MGVISEADILYKEHDPRQGRPTGPLAWLVDGSPRHGPREGTTR